MLGDKRFDASHFAHDLIDGLYSYEFTMCDNGLHERGELLDGRNWLVRVLVYDIERTPRSNGSLMELGS